MKMKLLFSVCALCATLLSSAANVVGGPFTINGKVKGADGQKVYLSYSTKADKQITQTAVISKGAFQFKGILPMPFVQATLSMGDSEDRNNRKWCSLLMEPGLMTTVLDMKNFQESVVKGSKSQNEYNALNASMNSIRAEMSRLRDAMGEAKDEKVRNAYSAQFDSVEIISDKMYAKFIESHPNSYVSPYLMMFNIGKMKYDVAQHCYDAFTPHVKQYGPFIDEIEKELASMKRVQPGQVAPDFTATDVNGKKISLSDLRGKYVLLDFWASWCVPCRRSFPHVKALYEKYKEKGLDVFCVGDNDRQEDKWREAIQKDGVEMFHHVLRGMKASVVDGKYIFDRTNDISSKFAIHFLPTKYLIDPEGKIIGKFDDKDLDAKLKNIFNF